MEFKDIKLTYYRDNNYQDIVKILSKNEYTKKVTFKVVDDPNDYWLDELHLSIDDTSTLDHDSVLNLEDCTELVGYGTPLYRSINEN